MMKHLSQNCATEIFFFFGLIIKFAETRNTNKSMIVARHTLFFLVINKF